MKKIQNILILCFIHNILAKQGNPKCLASARHYEKKDYLIYQLIKLIKHNHLFKFYVERWYVGKKIGSIIYIEKTDKSEIFNNITQISFHTFNKWYKDYNIERTKWNEIEVNPNEIINIMDDFIIPKKLKNKFASIIY